MVGGLSGQCDAVALHAMHTHHPAAASANRPGHPSPARPCAAPQLPTADACADAVSCRNML